MSTEIPTRQILHKGELVDFHLSSTKPLAVALKEYPNWEYLSSGNIYYLNGKKTGTTLSHFFRMTPENQAIYDKNNQ